MADYELFHQFYELPAEDIDAVEEWADSGSLLFQRKNHRPNLLSTPKMLDGYFLDSRNQPLQFDVNGELSFCNNQISDAYLVFTTENQNNLTICHEGQGLVAVAGDYKAPISLQQFSQLMASLHHSYEDYLVSGTITRLDLLNQIDCLAEIYTMNSTIFADLSNKSLDYPTSNIHKNKNSEITTGSVSVIKNVDKMSITENLVVSHHTQINSEDGLLNRVISGEFIKVIAKPNDDHNLARTVVYRPVGDYCLSYDVNGVKYQSLVENLFEPINQYNGLLFSTMRRVLGANKSLRS